MKITDTIKYVGVNDHRSTFSKDSTRFRNGMSYNSYVILDEKTAGHGYCRCQLYPRMAR